MKILINVVGALLLVFGAIWALQGANLIGGSFMTGQSSWLYIGSACLVAGLVVLWWQNFRRGAG